MFQLLGINGKGHSADVIERGRGQRRLLLGSIGANSRKARLLLREVQSTRAGVDDRFALYNLHFAVALLIEVSKPSAQGLENVGNAQFQIWPGVSDRVLEIEHHA